MGYSIDDIVNYIEVKNDIKLYPYQKVLLFHLLNGDRVSIPRRSGRTTLINGYKEFIELKHGRHIHPEEADFNISYENIYEQLKERE